MKWCIPVSHPSPVHPAAHVHTPGSIQVPPFMQSGEHTAVIICTFGIVKLYVFTNEVLCTCFTSVPCPSCCTMQVPPLSHPCSHTAVVIVHAWLSFNSRLTNEVLCTCFTSVPYPSCCTCALSRFYAGSSVHAVRGAHSCYHMYIQHS